MSIERIMLLYNAAWLAALFFALRWKRNRKARAALATTTKE